MKQPKFEVPLAKKDQASKAAVKQAPVAATAKDSKKAIVQEVSKKLHAQPQIVPV